MTPPNTHTHTHIITPTHPTTSSLPFHVSAYLQTRAHFIRTYQSRSEQRGGLPQSERSVSQPAVQNGDQKKKGRGGGKSLFSENTVLLSVCLLVTNVKRKKKYSPAVLLGKKRTFSEAERVGSPSFLGPCNSTSTSPLAERNMQTHFIDFWSFAEKPNWTSCAARALSAQAIMKRERAERVHGVQGA